MSRSAKHQPPQIREILIYYHTSQRDEKGIFSPETKDALVRDLIMVYSTLSSEEKAEFLVPARGSVLKDDAITVPPEAGRKLIYRLNYDWPDDEEERYGFEEDPSTIPCRPVKKGELYDRIGGTGGTYFCPIRKDGTPEPYIKRAIPYYIPDESDVTSSPAYHLYRVINDYKENDSFPKMGLIASVFRTKLGKDGGGIQLVFKNDSADILVNEKGVLEDVVR